MYIKYNVFVTYPIKSKSTQVRHELYRSQKLNIPFFLLLHETTQWTLNIFIQKYFFFEYLFLLYMIYIQLITWVGFALK
jgi:hypothetical protein